MAESWKSPATAEAYADWQHDERALLDELRVCVRARVCVCPLRK
jgi:hypothetical protein